MCNVSIVHSSYDYLVSLPRSRRTVPRNKKEQWKEADLYLAWARGGTAGYLSLSLPRPPNRSVGRSVCLSLGKANGVVWVPVAPGDAQTFSPFPSPQYSPLPLPMLSLQFVPAGASCTCNSNGNIISRVSFPLIISEDRKCIAEKARGRTRPLKCILAAIQILILVFRKKSRETIAGFRWQRSRRRFPRL